jgi:hypothetical protein
MKDGVCSVTEENCEEVATAFFLGEVLDCGGLDVADSTKSEFLCRAEEVSHGFVCY